jgi:hypothetical protein
MESSSSGQSRTAKSSLTVIALDVSPRCLPLLPAVKDALAARLTHEMLANAKTAEVALMAFGTKGKKKKKKKRKEKERVFFSSSSSAHLFLLLRHLLSLLY